MRRPARLPLPALLGALLLALGGASVALQLLDRSATLPGTGMPGETAVAAAAPVAAPDSSGAELDAGAAPGPGSALVVPVEGSIGAATAELAVNGIAQAELEGAPLVILRMDTPGGLDSAMRRIIQAILGSRVPVAVYVAPQGARAASAGTYILYASHIAAMAPATNLGAATPVQVGGLPGGAGEEDDDSQPSAMERKLVNDAVAYIRGLAELRERNAAWAEQAVREAVSLSSGAALDKGVIDLVAEDIPTLLERIDGMTVSLPGGLATLDTADLGVRTLEPGWRARLLAVIANPNVAYLLLLIGFYGIVFELASPGAVLPGVVGAVSLLVALYALQLLPVSYAGLGLVLLGMALMAAEAFVPSFGAFGVGGLVAFVVGSVILMDGDQLAVSLPLVAVTAVLTTGFFLWVLGRLVAFRRRAPVTGVQGLVGSIAEAREAFEREGRVHVEGEDWQAVSGVPVAAGERLRVTRVKGLRLWVEPLSKR